MLFSKKSCNFAAIKNDIMRIERLELRNFRCFEHISAKLHPKMNVMVGINGTGKTTMLEAIRIFVGAAFCELDKIENRISSPSIADDDVRLHNLESQYPVRIEGVVDVDKGLLPDKLAQWDRTLEKYGGRTKFDNSKDVKSLSKNIQSIIRDGKDIPIPVIAYYSTDRYKKEKRNTGLEADGSRLRGYYNALDSTTNIWFFLNIIKTETLWELQEGKKSAVLSMVRKVIVQCVPDCKEIKHDVKQDKLIITQANGEKVPFSSLSDGVRNVLSMVMELALRCYLLNPSQGENAPSETPGIVLIDEIDLHLHPEWQLHILNDLTSVFGRIQFIVSTHAPLILSSLQDGEILSISDRKVYNFPNQYKRRPEQILKDMNTSIASDDIEKALADYRLLIEAGKGKSEEAVALRKKLVSALGEGHEELQRTDIMLQLF